MAGFEGKDVSIKLKRDLGIFQGNGRKLALFTNT